MCCFSLDVESVSGTNIFARATHGARQVLVYAMDYAAAEPLAMVLPIPVVAGSGEDAVRFIDLSACPGFFDDLAGGFRSRSAGGDVEMLDLDLLSSARTLEVRAVGDFEASFVPTPADFGRLDERFRLPADLWLQLNRYRDYGFAVFKLRDTSLARVHPMAFEFPRRDPARLFFPTVHVHHRRVDPHADFDHTLYCQPEPPMNWHLHAWTEAHNVAGQFVTCPQARELVDPDFPVWRAEVSGRRENRDTWLGPGETLPVSR